MARWYGRHMQRRPDTRSVFLAAVIMATSLFAVSPVASTKAEATGSVVSATKGARCTKKFQAEGTTLMCLPMARGAGLTWQKYPVLLGSCSRVGTYAPPARLYCKRFSTGYARAYARPFWIDAPGPFRYFTIYGNSWLPQRGRECAVHNATTDWLLFQSQWQGTATCVQSADGNAWTWQQTPAKNRTCALAGARWGKLVCARAGGRKIWSAAPKESRTPEAIVREVRRFYAYVGSQAFSDLTDEYRTYSDNSMEEFPNGGGFSRSMYEELKNRAALSGVSVVSAWDYPMNYGNSLVVVKWADGQRCFRPDHVYQEVSKNSGVSGLGQLYGGSEADIPEIPCDTSAALANALARTAEIDAALWRTGDMTAWRNSILMLGQSPDLDLLTWKWVRNKFIEVDDNSYRVGVRGQVTLNRAVTPAVPTKTTYVIQAACYNGTWNGTTSTLTAVTCA